jgi:CDGSH-type Zn-finger protein/uncharacterized Fe-S cluster protein YjdI
MNTEREPAPSREQLLYLLHEASEIEHNLMCCYLYAAFSLKGADARWSPRQADAVARFRRVLTSVALEEMTHLCNVANLMTSLGALPHFGRPNLPVDAGPYPAGFVIRLQAFSRATIEHFEFLERPHGVHVEDAPGFEPTRVYRRAPRQVSRLSPLARDYDTVGDLYGMLVDGLRAFVAEKGERALFLGDPAMQVDATLAPLPGVCRVVDFASAERAIQTIVAQGEGAGAESADSHFSRFRSVREELDALTAEDPSFTPAWPAATNPLMNLPPIAEGRVHVDHPDIVPWLDIGNAMYTTSLRCLLQGFVARDRRAKAAWLRASFDLMKAVTPVGQGLAARPAKATPDSPNAGLSFTTLRTLGWLPDSVGPASISERLGELAARARSLLVVPVEGESPETWARVITTLEEQQGKIAGIVATAAPAPSPPSPPALASTAAAPAAAPSPSVERARGEHLTVLFEGKRCIHSRHCVLDAQTVFKANTPGEWIFPDTVDKETVVEVAHRCPSGAIRYERHDGGAPEAPPKVNTLFVRENGPYAVRAALNVAGDTSRFRATLCRCGQSKNKPYCDGAHATAGFTASGEPATSAPDPLPARDGALSVRPLRNGPLEIEGNLEICAGTGRTVARVSDARLCRCGQSKNKPFCDMSHASVGFEAEGE